MKPKERTDSSTESQVGKGYLRVRKVAEILDFSKSQVYDLLYEGSLQGFKHGQTLRISIESLEVFIKRHRIEATEGGAPRLSR